MAREQLEVDVLFVGGGVSALASAIHLLDLVAAHNAAVAGGAPGRKLEELQVAVVEKGATFGAHAFSGAVVECDDLRRLLPDPAEFGSLPFECDVRDERVYFLTGRGAFRLPVIPRNLRNAGNKVVSLAKLTARLAELAEARGAMLLPGFAATELLMDGRRVAGVVTGDKGVAADGSKKSNYEPGNEILSGVTVFAEGSRGSLTRKLIADLGLSGRFPQVFELGVKEVFELPEGRSHAGLVWHASGFPLSRGTGGGSFFYGMASRLCTLGVAASLDTPDPLLDVHAELQRLKGHPLVADLLAGAKTVAYGGKTLSAGGYYTLPRPVASGALLIGEAGGFLNPEKLKGVHLAVRSGMLAARTILKCLKLEPRDFSEKALGEYAEAARREIAERELHRCRNFHAAIGSGNTFKTFLHAGLQEVTFGRGLIDPMPLHDDHLATRTLAETHGGRLPDPPKYDGGRTLDKLADVYLTGTSHDEHQPGHLKVGDPSRCAECFGKPGEGGKYGAPCVRFCPAAVYEVEEAGGGRRLKVNFTNCIHCKTCDIKCPYLNILWTPPEGGGGPKYTVQ